MPAGRLSFKHVLLVFCWKFTIPHGFLLHGQRSFNLFWEMAFLFFLLKNTHTEYLSLYLTGQQVGIDPWLSRWKGRSLITEPSVDWQMAFCLQVGYELLMVLSIIFHFLFVYPGPETQYLNHLISLGPRGQRKTLISFLFILTFCEILCVGFPILSLIFNFILSYSYIYIFLNILFYLLG